MVANGIGISIVPALYKQQLSALKLNFCEVDKPIISRRVGIISKKRHSFSHAADEFIKIIQAHYNTP
jgi:LysR family carnitine catabolism transcriptional activator